MATLEPPSSPPSGDAAPAGSLAWYKSQYEQLETELAEFRVSSEELEKELEKDLDAAEKRENVLREKAEGLSFEVDEWKRKYKESKAEANSAQNTLEKEITTLRDSNRTLQHKLRDIEVANDDFERQARITDSSLEDMESKYNAAIEKVVMMEEEIKIGEQEREQLRIEAQRLREELSDLKIEAEILQDKMRKQEQQQRHMSTVSTELSIPDSPVFDNSTVSGASSPIITTPPESSISSKTPVNEPPSPPMSDASAPLPKSRPRVPSIKTPAPTRPRKLSRLPPTDSCVTPKPRMSTGPSRPTTARPATTNTSMRTTAAPRSTAKAMPGRGSSNRLPPSTSLNHIRTLTAQMQRLEARVQSVRSKLPAPTTTPPRASPRPAAISNGILPIRSRKRGVSSVSSSTASRMSPDDQLSLGLGLNRSHTSLAHLPKLSNSGMSRLSFGPLPNRGPVDSGSEISRPSSRASSSYARPVSRAEGWNDSMIAPPRPVSRAGGARTPLGRPISRASFGGSFHAHTMSLSHSTAEEDEPVDTVYRTPSRRGTYSRAEGGTGGTGIPIPSSRRPSLANVNPAPMRRPSLVPGLARKTSTQPIGDLGETY